VNGTLPDVDAPSQPPHRQSLLAAPIVGFDLTLPLARELAAVLGIPPNIAAGSGLVLPVLAWPDGCHARVLAPTIPGRTPAQPARARCVGNPPGADRSAYVDSAVVR
jgi:hypothetical protein